MKNIIVFHPSNELYGADRILVNALQSFPEKSKKTVVLPKEGPLTEILRNEVPNIEVLILPKMPIIYRALFTPKGIIQFLGDYRKFYVWLQRIHKEKQFDLAYVNTLSCSFILPMLRSLKVRSFVHVHEILEKPLIVAKTTAFIARKYADSVICVSKAVSDNLIRLHSKIAEKSTVLHNGIRPIEIVDRPNRNVLLERRMQFYVFGRIMPKKGQWYLIEALRLLPKETINKAQFHLVGGTPPGQDHLWDELKALISESGLDSAVEMKGFCSDISNMMSEADCCIVPSLMRDPFPTTVLEAMSAQKPVIATDHGGAAEAINSYENGVLIHPNDPKMLAEAIEYAIENPAIMHLLGEKAFETYEKRFRMEVFQENWLRYHRRLLSQFEKNDSNVETIKVKTSKNKGIQVLEQKF